MYDRDRKYIPMEQEYGESFKEIATKLREYRPVVLGGAVRDHMYNTPFKDIDMMLLEGNLDSLLEELDIPYELNHFNGLKFDYKGIEYDCWFVQNNYLHQQIPRQPQNLSNVLPSGYLNLDHILYDVNNQVFYLDAFEHMLHTNHIDMYHPYSSHLISNLGKSLYGCEKYNLRLSPYLQYAIRNEYITNGQEFTVYFQNKYKQPLAKYLYRYMELYDLSLYFKLYSNNC